MTKIIENLQQWDEEEKREAAMTAEKTPPVSEGWPTPEEIVDEKRDCLLAFKCQFTHEDAASKQMRILFAAAWAVENRPKLEALVRKLDDDRVQAARAGDDAAANAFQVAAENLQDILTKEPQ